jgi:hypothetical protein
MTLQETAQRLRGFSVHPGSRCQRWLRNRYAPPLTLTSPLATLFIVKRIFSSQLHRPSQGQVSDEGFLTDRRTAA